MAQSRLDDVKEAVKRIQALYELGRQLPRKQAHKDTYNQGVIQAEAERLGIHEDSLRKARHLADPVEGYTRKELNDLCRLVKKVQPGQGDDKAVFTQSHLVRLLSVPSKKKRADLQRQAVREGWSTAELKAAIARRYGTRRDGGRRRRQPRDVPDLLVQLEGMCEGWRRWRAALFGGPAREQAAHALVKQLPARLRKQIDAVADAVGGLQLKVVEELAKAQPGRVVRGALQDAQQVTKKAAK